MTKTEGYEVFQLEKLYALLCQSIYRHRRDFDKTTLIQVSIDEFHSRRKNTDVTNSLNKKPVYGSSLTLTCVFPAFMCLSNCSIKTIENIPAISF